MPGTLSETFFRPEQLACERLTIPAALYNRCRLVLGRCEGDHVFIPIRSMQILAVIGPEEVIFVDSQDYAVQDGQGGKLIFLSWAFRHEVGRDDLTDPAPIEMRYYREDARELHGRLVGEFRQALEGYAARAQETIHEPRAGKVLPFRR
ncbi:MAG: hypothetical protein HKP03_04425 [Xanthomonadales bacterium]|nr:hypothetical protein [Gammaproteobacteria bacterium]NNK37700.1 hypothetical protein [Xanthomonadales bacterium]